MNVIADKIPEERAYGVPNESPFYIGDIRVNPFHLSHDAAEPTGYSFAHDGRQVTIVTDTGFVSEEIFSPGGISRLADFRGESRGEYFEDGGISISFKEKNFRR